MKNEKLYFLNIDDTNCYPLSDRLNDARLEGLRKVRLVEAVPDNDNPDYVWCAQHGEVTERQECKKAVCSYYESKSGRGVCSNRGNLYCHGDEVTFDVPTEAVSRRFFEDAQDFNQFMINEKPKEIWLDEFMKEEPYIILSFNDGVNFRGVYNHQCLLGGDNSDFTWLYKSGMYVKTFC